MSYVLDLTQPHHCHLDPSNSDLICNQCKGNKPTAGCDLVIQGNAVYGWSESNVQYERLGFFRKEE